MAFRQYLLDSLIEIIGNLKESGRLGQRSENMLRKRLTVLCEAALVNGDVPLEIIDFMDQARRLLNVALKDRRSFRGYEAQAVNKGGRTGRPTFSISEEQLVFFEGSKSSCFFNIKDGRLQDCKLFQLGNPISIGEMPLYNVGMHIECNASKLKKDRIKFIPFRCVTVKTNEKLWPSISHSISLPPLRLQHALMKLTLFRMV